MLGLLQLHLGYLGDTFVSLKLPPQAQGAFEERLSVRRKRHELKPKDTQLRWEVSIALDRIGQLFRDDRLFDRSRKYFDEALKIDRDLYQGDPGRWQENLVFSLTRIGDLERQLGRQREALRPLEEALKLQRTVATDVSAAGPQQTLASLLQKVGDSQAPPAGLPRGHPGASRGIGHSPPAVGARTQQHRRQAQRFERARLSGQHVAREQGSRRVHVPPSATSSSLIARSPRLSPTTSRASPTSPGA